MANGIILILISLIFVYIMFSDGGGLFTALIVAAILVALAESFLGFDIEKGKAAVQGGVNIESVANVKEKENTESPPVLKDVRPIVRNRAIIEQFNLEPNMINGYLRKSKYAVLYTKSDGEYEIVVPEVGNLDVKEFLMHGDGRLFACYDRECWPVGAD